jgi:methylglutamate dehydrogenase subunit D
MPNRHSALAATTPRVARAGPDTLTLAEGPVSRWTQLGVYPGGAAAVAAAFAQCVGVALPTSTRQTVADGASRVYRVAVDQYLLRDVSAEALARLDAAMPAEAGALTDLTDSRVTLEIHGRAARDVLCQWITVDLDPTVFGVGEFALTGLHHVGGLLERTGEDAYAFHALRTYALTVWEALADAALPLTGDEGTGASR